VKYQSLIASKKVLISPPYVEPGLVKQFVKALNKENDALKYIFYVFLYLSKAKVESCNFPGPDVLEMFQSQ